MFKNLFLLFKNINLSINILGCLIIKYLYNFSFGMQFSRYIMQRISLQMRLKDSNFNIFHPFQRNTDVISISLRFKLRSMRCAIFLNSNFALLVLIKKNMWRHPPTLPYRLQYSTIGRLGLNHRVRNGNGCVP